MSSGYHIRSTAGESWIGLSTAKCKNQLRRWTLWQVEMEEDRPYWGLGSLMAVNHMWQVDSMQEELRFGLRQLHLMLCITHPPSTSDFSHNGRQM